MKRLIELTIIQDDIRWVEADLVMLKYASGFHGADAAVAGYITESSDFTLENVAEQIEKEGHFITNTNSQIQAKEVLFVKMPSLSRIYSYSV